MLELLEFLILSIWFIALIGLVFDAFDSLRSTLQQSMPIVKI